MKKAKRHNYVAIIFSKYIHIKNMNNYNNIILY